MNIWENVITIAAWILVVLSIMGILYGPFVIGKRQKTWEPANYLVYVFRAALIVAVCGRNLGWW